MNLCLFLSCIVLIGVGLHCSMAFVGSGFCSLVLFQVYSGCDMQGNCRLYFSCFFFLMVEDKCEKLSRLAQC